MIANYKESKIKADDFRDLSEIERKLLVQRFIDQIIYDTSKFKVAVRVLQEWEKNSNNINKK